MKVLSVYDYNRRDCKCDLECEGCGHKVEGSHAYDDDNFWVNVILNRKCTKCGKSTKDLNLEPEKIDTRYPEGFQV